MASDLPPYLTHNASRGTPWKGHATFPRNVIAHHTRGTWGTYGPLKLEDLRIFKFTLDGYGQMVYVLMHEEDIQKHMDDPTRV